MDETELYKVGNELKDDVYGVFHAQCDNMDMFYNLDFPLADIPGFDKVHHCADARINVDNAASQIDTTSLQVRVPPRSVDQKDKLSSTKMEKFYRGCQRAIAERDPLILHRVPKHGYLYGVAFIKTLYDGLWALKKVDGESDESYADRLNKWRVDRNRLFPFVTRLVHPKCLLPDPSDERLFFYEWRELRVRDVKAMYPLFKTDKEDSQSVKWVEYWSPTEYCYWCDEEVVKGLDENTMGFCPYDIVDAGLGYNDDKNSPECLWRGILHGIRDSLTTQSQLMLEYEAAIRMNLFLDRWFEPADNTVSEATVLRAKQSWEKGLGIINHLPPGVRLNERKPVVLPVDVAMMLAQKGDEVERATVPKVATGEGPTGPASGYKTALMAGMARIRFGPLVNSMQRWLSSQNSKMAIMVEQFEDLQDGITVWGRVGTELFEETVTPKDINGYYVNEVKLSTIAPEEESRKLHDGIALAQSGLASKYDVQTRFLGMEDPHTDDLQRLIEEIRNHPQIKDMLAQEIIGKQILGPTGQPINLGNQGNAPPPSMSGPSPQAIPGMAETLVRQKQPGSREETDITAKQIAGGI